LTSRATPTPVVHFTHVDHIVTLIEHGLLSDNSAQSAGVLSVEVGNAGIKDQRRRRAVPISPGGSVADYVPFYFAPRSPMMFAIAKGNVPTYDGGTARLVYLVSSLEQLIAAGTRPVLTDRNAALDYAAYREFELEDPLDDGFIDWEVMKAQYWLDHDDGRERRMAEALVYGGVPWSAILRIGAQNETVAEEVRAHLAAAGLTLQVKVVPRWYF
jgi:hypothetical protein